MLHYSVLLKESIELLNIKPDGVYIDGTFGRGGHSRAILDKLNQNGQLFAFDKDIEAINYGHEKISDSRFTLIHDSFANIDKYQQNIDGIILDLGVSSPQLANNRGFSFNINSELDMRMDTSQGVSCKRWINSIDEATLAQVLDEYGEEKFAKRIARNIVSARKTKPINTTFDLVDIIKSSIPFKEKAKHPATRSFQGIRIAINNELEDLKIVLQKIPSLLKLNARAVIISFHSLEDRIVKNVFKELSIPKALPKWVLIQDEPINFKIIAKKIRASLTELQQNARSRSAIMRSLEKIA